MWQEEKYLRKKGRYVQPISTAEWFRLSHDDMIFYWTENGDVVFSDELWNWFQELKLRFDRWIKTDFSFKKPLAYLLDLMEEVDSTYYRIYTFSNFFEETLEHLHDKRYQVLWKLYEEMIYDPELKAAGKAVSEDRRFSAYSWEWMDLKRRNNKSFQGGKR